MNRRVLGVWHDENSTVSLFLSFEFAADGGAIAAAIRS
jgi:hypothetical protein